MILHYLMETPAAAKCNSKLFDISRPTGAERSIVNDSICNKGILPRAADHVRVTLGHLQRILGQNPVDLLASPGRQRDIPDRSCQLRWTAIVKFNGKKVRVRTVFSRVDQQRGIIESSEQPISSPRIDRRGKSNQSLRIRRNRNHKGRASRAGSYSISRAGDSFLESSRKGDRLKSSSSSQPRSAVSEISHSLVDASAFMNRYMNSTPS